MSDQHYVHATADDDLEFERLTLLTKMYDPPTQRRLSSTVDLAGARVLEVGAGTGSVARWLGDQVGEDGHVTATDIDLRFLENLNHPNVGVHQHDVLADDLESDTFDLIHGRFVLTHLYQEAEEVIAKLIGALRPGGCLLFEEVDFGTLVGADPEHPLSSPLREAFDWLLELVVGLGAQNPQFGRNLPPLFRSTSLTDVESWAEYDISPPGSDHRRFQELSFMSATKGLAGAPGFDPTKAEPLLTGLRAPDLHVGEMTVVGVKGYRPT